MKREVGLLIVMLGVLSALVFYYSVDLDDLGGLHGNPTNPDEAERSEPTRLQKQNPKAIPRSESVDGDRSLATTTRIRVFAKTNELTTPVIGAKVVVSNGDGFIGPLVTDTEGMSVFDTRPLQRLNGALEDSKIYVLPPGGMVVSKSVILGEARVINFEIPVARTISGQLMLNGEQPGREFPVNFRPKDQSRIAYADIPSTILKELGGWPLKQRVSTVADKKGNFTFRLPTCKEGSLLVGKELQLLSPTMERVDSQKVALTSATTRVVLNTTRRRAFVGHIVDSENQAPITGVVLKAWQEPQLSFTMNIRSDDAGRFVILQNDGVVTLKVVATKVFRGKPAQVEAQFNGPFEHVHDLGNIELSIPLTRELALSVKDLDGKPVSGAIAVNADGVLCKSTNDTGITSIRLPKGEPVRILVSAPGHAYQVINVGESQSTIAAVIAKIGEEKFAVLDALGNPCDGFKLTAKEALLDKDLEAWKEMMFQNTGATPAEIVTSGKEKIRSVTVPLDGIVTMRCIRAGKESLTVEGFFGEKISNWDFEKNDKSGSVLRIAGSSENSIQGFVRDKVGAPIVGAKLTATTSDGQHAISCRSNAKGEYRLETGAQRLIEVTVVADGYSMLQRSLVCGESRIEDLHLVRTTDLELIVQDTDGGSVSGIKLWWQEGKRWAKEQGNGEFVFSGCPEGTTITVLVSAVGGHFKRKIVSSPEPKIIQIPAFGEMTLSWDLTFTPAGRFTVVLERMEKQYHVVIDPSIRTKKGSHHILGVMPGTYRLKAHIKPINGAEQVVDLGSVTVVGGRTATLAIKN